MDYNSINIPHVCARSLHMTYCTLQDTMIQYMSRSGSSVLSCVWRGVERACYPYNFTALQTSTPWDQDHIKMYGTLKWKLPSLSHDLWLADRQWEENEWESSERVYRRAGYPSFILSIEMLTAQSYSSTVSFTFLLLHLMGLDMAKRIWREI